MNDITVPILVTASTTDNTPSSSSSIPSSTTPSTTSTSSIITSLPIIDPYSSDMLYTCRKCRSWLFRGNQINIHEVSYWNMKYERDIVLVNSNNEYKYCR